MQPPGGIHKCQQIASDQAFLWRGEVQPDLFRQMITQGSFRRFHGFNAGEVIFKIAASTTANRWQAIVVNIIPFGIERRGIFRRQRIRSGGTCGIGWLACCRQGISTAASIRAGDGAFIAFQQRVAFKFFLDKGRDFHIGRL